MFHLQTPSQSGFEGLKYRPMSAETQRRVNSSAVEHLVYTEAVGGSNPSSRTFLEEGLSASISTETYNRGSGQSSIKVDGKL